jgi:hypothetical protein
MDRLLATFIAKKKTRPLQVTKSAVTGQANQPCPATS